MENGMNNGMDNSGMENGMEQWMHTTCVTGAVLQKIQLATMCLELYLIVESVGASPVFPAFFLVCCHDVRKWDFPNSESPETNYTTMHGGHVYTTVTKVVRT